MNKRHIIITITAIIGTTILLIRARTRPLETSTVSKEATYKTETTPTVSESIVLTPTTTPTPKTVADCESVENTIRSAANSFMKKHINRDAMGAINSITSPSTTDETSEYDFLLGKDLGNEIRLYNTAQFAYETTSYKLAQLSSAGSHQTERGALACDLTVREDRSTNSNGEEELFIEETVARHLIFSVSASGIIQLTDYSIDVGSGKYSGFN